MNDRSSTVDRVQDTARWVAMSRALESERPDALFKDPYARRLAGAVGQEIFDKLNRKLTGTWPIVARTWILDGLVRQAVQDGADAVVNLAAGMDTRPYRLELPASLAWIEVDHADVIAQKESELRDAKPVCQLERVAQDLSDPDGRRRLLARLGARFRRPLVITEGLLVYLPEQTVVTLAQDLRATPAVFRWIADLNNAAVNRFVARRSGGAFRGTAAMQFGPQQGPLFFEPLGWSVRSATSLFKTAGKLKRLKFPMSLFARLPEGPYGSPKRPWSGVCVFEPKC